MKKPFILLWGLAGFAFIFSWIYLPALSKYQDLKVRQEGIDLQIKELQEKIDDMQEERNLLKNDVNYLEKIIRSELGLVKPGEIVYKFVPDKPAEKPVPESKAAPAPSASAAPKTQETKTGETPKTPAPGAAQGITLPAKPIIAPPPVTAKETTPEAPMTSGPVYPRRETR